MKLIIYSRQDCHLCEAMHTVVLSLQNEFCFTLEQLDIDTDPKLRVRYDTKVPVLLINDRLAFKYRVEAEALRKRLLDELQNRYSSFTKVV